MPSGRPRSAGPGSGRAPAQRTGTRPAAGRRGVGFRRLLARRLTALFGALVLVAALVILVRHVLAPGGIGAPSCTFTNAEGASFDLDPEQARNAATISAVATKRGLPPRAATIAVATAMQESKLRNLPGGDRDSLGLFQQRPSQGWGTAVQIRNPVYATGKFYDALVGVPGWETLPLTQAAQKVQLSAAPDAYAQHETEAATYAQALTGVRAGAVGCRLKEAQLGPTAEHVRAQLQTETGLTAAVTDGALVLQTGTARQAATAASWAVAAAEEFGVTEVRLGSTVWRRGTSAEALTWPDSGEHAAATAVRITLARR